MGGGQSGSLPPTPTACLPKLQARRGQWPWGLPVLQLELKDQVGLSGKEEGGDQKAGIFPEDGKGG